MVQESRLWNQAEGRTYSMRSKEQAHDYRYFPEPDLPPLVVGAEWQAEILKALPELPEARRARMEAEYGISRAGCDDVYGNAARSRISLRRRRRRAKSSAAGGCAADQRDYDAGAGGGDRDGGSRR